MTKRTGGEVKMAKNKKEVPTGKLRRSSIVGTTTAKAGLKKLGHLSKTPFLSEERKNISREKNDEEIARMIFSALSKLKGTPLKAAQMIAMEIDLIPEAYRKELMKSTSSVPPINRALIRKIISSQLGAPPEKLFARFDPISFAAASLGQVHRATGFDGRELAVKIQYPGIAGGISSDIDMLKALLMPTRYYNMLKSCFLEIEERITEELDYLQEAENTSWFRENLKFDEVVIPEVVPELSALRVLTTTHVEGLHIEEWLETSPSQEERDYYGSLLVEIFWHTLHEKKVIHADPNPGNYIFMDEGKLGIIDFGCIKKVDDRFASLNTRAIEHYNKKDMSQLKELYDEMGIYYRKSFDDENFTGFITRWMEWLTRPMRQEYFDFGNSEEYFRERMELGREFYSHVDHFSGDFIYFGRAEFGLYSLLKMMGARVSLQCFLG